MGKKKRRQQKDLWVATSEMPVPPGHPFYVALEDLLKKHQFDDFVERRCAQFYAPRMGRPSLEPGVYFRLLLVGYFEGLGSERGIAWRAADSLGLREFLGLKLSESPPDHSTLSRTRRLIDVQTHAAEAAEHLEQVMPEDGAIQEVVADKGYHSTATMKEFKALDLRSYVSEPDRGGRKWKGDLEGRDAVYANRRRVRGERGRRLLRMRGERLERPFAHLYRTGGLRRTEVRGHSNVLKRLLIQAGAFNLGMLLRKQVGAGTPRGLQAQVLRAMLLVFGLVNATKQLIGEIVGTFLGKFRMQTSFTRRRPESIPGQI